MARDHALAVALEPGEGLLRWYRWSNPTLSLGRNEPTEGRWSPDRLDAAGVDVVRRPTGGRAVLHDRELTYAIMIPAAGPGSARRLYEEAGAALVMGLLRLGVRAERVGTSARAPAPDAGPCFVQPVRGEVTVGGRKLVGSAQVRLEGKLLQHGSILLGDDQRRLTELSSSREGSQLLAPSSTHLGEWLDPVPSTEVLVQILTYAFRDSFGGDWHGASAAITLDPAPLERLENHYRSPSWTWRR